MMKNIFDIAGIENADGVVGIIVSQIRDAMSGSMDFGDIVFGWDSSIFEQSILCGVNQNYLIWY